MTKYTTRYDPPDIFEALDAAEGLTDDAAEQAEIAASLLGVSVDDARAAIDKRAEAVEARRARMERIATSASRQRAPATGNGAYASSPDMTPPDMSWYHGFKAPQHGGSGENGHPLDNRGMDQHRPSHGRRAQSSTPEVVVVRKGKPRSTATPHDAARPASARRPSLEGKLRLNLNN
ncbi:hypothetical protein [Fodinicurvata sp. EGI_FJ10296]|uniref:hypothetical protein n=1 Tax=Fodinicurvata sp. EGI_FJ10296 TaxID=3231908 RepID=UPI003454F357